MSYSCYYSFFFQSGPKVTRNCKKINPAAPSSFKRMMSCSTLMRQIDLIAVREAMDPRHNGEGRAAKLLAHAQQRNSNLSKPPTVLILYWGESVNREYEVQAVRLEVVFRDNYGYKVVLLPIPTHGALGAVEDAIQHFKRGMSA